MLAVPSTSREILDGDNSPQLSAYHLQSADIPAACDLCVLDDFRLFYIHHATKSSHWEPPWATWNCRLGLPYAWEQAVDADGRVYYIDHLNRRTTYTDPRQELLTEPRQVTIHRDSSKGFGFVAAGQQPTVVQFVSPGGPSDGKLFAQDEIIEVDGVDVSNQPKEEVVCRVRRAPETITLTVQQCRPSPRRQCRVRFTDSVQISSPESTGLPPPLPNVLRVFLENGQTRSFRYDEMTTVQDVCVSLGEKLCLNSLVHFCLCVEYNLGARSSRISLLRPETTLESIALLPNSTHLRCVFRFVFVPSDASQLLQNDPRAFEYFYSQCVNDVVQGRFAYEMRYEACIRLAALHIQQICLTTGCCFREGRISLRRVEKEFGLATFLPLILLENVKRKEVRRHLRYYLRRDDPVGEKNSVNQSTSTEKSLLTRLKYVQIVSHLPSFAGRSFSVTLKDSHTDMIVQVDPSSGLLMRHPGATKVGQPTISVGFDLLSGVILRPETAVLTNISILLNNNLNQGLDFLVDKDEASDLAMFLCGYYGLANGQQLTLDAIDSAPPDLEAGLEPPPYESVHAVIPAGWNYSLQASPGEKLIDFSEEPPHYDVANTFNDNSEGNTRGLELAKPELPPIEEENYRSNRLLKATDSLLIKSSKELHLKETTSPLLQRKSNPSGRKVDPFSDSSDTEGSSRASPTRLPRDSSTLSALSTLSELSSPEHSFRHHDSVETLVHSYHQNGGASTSGASMDGFNVIDLTLITPSDEKRAFREVASSTRRPTNGEPSQAHVVCKQRSEEGPTVYMSKMNLDRDGIEDFLRRSNSICDPVDDGAMEEVPVRRMSLKDYTGVEGERLRELENPSWKETVTSASLLNSCSKRRRSLLSTDTYPSGSAQKLSVQVEEPLALDIVRKRMESLRSRLAESAKTFANTWERIGPRVNEIKTKLISEVKTLEDLCKKIGPHGAEAEDGDATVTEIFEVSKMMVETSEELSQHCDVFHGKLIHEEVDLVLKSILAMLVDLGAEVPGIDPPIPQLTARLAQLRHTVDTL
ncbi:unnamed protein product, partial [Mesorhabditis belari]|uniref:FERM and PDZ domain-containing protein 4 n=1 Tax=Mesorhabditis belari TaxID=2138241 RepID=A0AAF3E8N4_9BILA